MFRKIENSVIDTFALVHLTYAVFKMYKANFPPEVMPIDTAFGGKFKYLTFWNVCIETAYFWFATLENILSGCTDNNNKPLRKIRDYWFMSIVFPLSMFVSLTFWAIYAVDRELVMPSAVDPYFPSWLNHSVHTFVLLYAVLEMVTTYHKTGKPFPVHCVAIWLVTVTYIIWCIIVWTQSDMWVYPILKVFSWPSRIVFFSANVLTVTIFLYLGFFFNNLTWKDKLQRS